MLRISHIGEVIRFDLARTLGGKGRYWTSGYLVDGLLIDTGPAHTAPEFMRALAEMPVLQVLNTHSHEDHIGANSLIQQTNPTIPFRAHPLALPVLADPRAKQPLHPYRLLFFGYPEPSHAEPIANSAVIETEHHRFQVVYTPGHSPDHLCLYEPKEGWLFAGDLYVGGQERVLRVDTDIRQLIESLKCISRLTITRLFPGSARVPENPAQALAAKIAYLEELGARVHELDAQGKSVQEIARVLLGGPTWVEWLTLGHLSRENLARSYLNTLKNSRSRPNREGS